MQLETVSKTHTGLVREINQDAMLVMDGRGVFLVADGMGGEQAGEEASAQVVATVRSSIRSFFQVKPAGPSQIDNLLRDTLHEANEDVCQIAVREPEKQGLGSTASLLCLHRGVYFAAQVGDSRIYLVRKGKATQLTRDHTLVWMLFEQGAITRDQLETHPERHLLTQCIGTRKPLAVDTLEGTIEEGDLFLLCSDGLTGYATEQQVFDIVSDKKLGLEEMADQLIEAALQAGGGDNVTAVLAKVKKLESEDNWRPEETAPPQKFDITLADTLIDEEMRPQQVPRSWRPKPRQWIPAAIVVLLIMIFSMLALRPSPIEVRLKPVGEMPEEIAICAEKEKGQITNYKLQMTNGKEMDIQLPGPGEYVLTATAPDYMPLRIAVPLDEKVVSSEVLLGPWTRMARLQLEMPELAQGTITRLRLKPNDPDGEAAEQTIEGDELSGKKIVELPIAPGTRYMVIVEAKGQRNFSRRTPPLQSGELRTIKVYFE